jgi:lysine 6-dehydrogenase
MEDAMGFRYAIFGAGRQGTAAAYDMIRWGEAESVLLADEDLVISQRSACQVNSLLEVEIAEAAPVNVKIGDQVSRVLSGVDVLLSAVPYTYNYELTEYAIQAGVHMCDLGGNTDIVRQQHGLDGKAKDKGVSVVPDCGLVPGMGMTLMVYAMELLDEADEVFMWDGGIPQNPHPPFGYMLTFNIEGLTNEYAESPIFIRDGKLVQVETMTELETVEFPEPIGKLEAFVTGGGISTLPWTYEGRLTTMQNKTLRYPGHFNQLRAYYDLGLWDKKPIESGEVEVIPRDVFHALFEPRVSFPEDKDMVVLRVKSIGIKGGRKAEVVIDLIDYYDEETGFTSMERTTGFSAAIVAEMMARGEIERGVGGVETFIPRRPFIEELRVRGFNLDQEVQYLEDLPG